MINLKKQKVASNGRGAVLVGELGGVPVLLRYAPRGLGNIDRRAELDALVDRALLKLDWKRDRRCKSGYRKVSA